MNFIELVGVMLSHNNLLIFFVQKLHYYILITVVWKELGYNIGNNCILKGVKMTQMSSIKIFQEKYPALESYWRSVILVGRNVASYKFALAKSLLEIAPTGKR